MKIIIIICCNFMLLYACSTIPCKDNLNLLPMYGNEKKCKQQIEIDSLFLHECDTIFKNRKEAAAYYVYKAWQYWQKNIVDTAMLRFNQAWLLDSMNADIYWGFANLLGMQKKYEKSIPFFKKSISLNPNNSRVWESASISYGNLFLSTQHIVYLDTSISYLKQSIKIEPTARGYGQLTAVYCYFAQKDSAIKYLKITDQLDPKAVNDEVRQLLKKKTNNP